MGKRPEGWVGSDLRARAEVVQWLTLHGGEIHDPQGLIVGRMRTDLRKGRALSQLIADMENDGMIQREVRGRRTMMLKLVNDWGLLDEVRDHQDWQIAGTAREEDEALATGDVDLDALAAALLARVVKQAHAVPSNGAEVERLKEQLAEAKARATDLGHQLIEAKAEAEDQRKAADTMRESLQKLEASRTNKSSGGVKLRDALSAKDRALLDRLMREPPKG